MELDENERRLLQGTGWGMWALSWMALAGLGAALLFASILIGSDEAVAARPYFMAALACVFSAGLVLAAGVARGLAGWARKSLD